MVDHLSKNPSKSRILIVEDDKSIRETLREALVAEGYAVEVCKTGDEAQTRIFSQFDTSKKLDLVVLDLMLPNLNGIELCRRVRKNNIKTPILIVSAKDSESDRVLGLEVGLNAVSAFTAIGAIRPNAAGAINKLLNNFIVSSHRIKVKLDMRSKMKFIGCTFRPD